jgi:hypothetical protein
MPDERTYGVDLTAEELVELQELVCEREDLPWTESVNRKLGRVISFVQKDRGEAQ